MILFDDHLDGVKAMFKAIAKSVKDFLGITPRVLLREESTAQLSMLFGRKAGHQRARTPVQQLIVANASDTPAEAEARKARLRFLVHRQMKCARKDPVVGDRMNVESFSAVWQTE